MTVDFNIEFNDFLMKYNKANNNQRFILNEFIKELENSKHSNFIKKLHNIQKKYTVYDIEKNKFKTLITNTDLYILTGIKGKRVHYFFPSKYIFIPVSSTIIPIESNVTSRLKIKLLNFEDNINFLQSKNNNFKCIGISLHIGDTAGGGHYICLKKINNTWYQFNDSIVKKLDDVHSHYNSLIDNHGYTTCVIMMENIDYSMDKDNDLYDDNQKLFDFYQGSTSNIDPKGIKNLSNTCYLNAFLQLIINDPYYAKFMKEYYRFNFHNDKNPYFDDQSNSIDYKFDFDKFQEDMNKNGFSLNYPNYNDDLRKVFPPFEDKTEFKIIEDTKLQSPLIKLDKELTGLNMGDKVEITDKVLGNIGIFIIKAIDESDKTIRIKKVLNYIIKKDSTVKKVHPFSSTTSATPATPALPPAPAPTTHLHHILSYLQSIQTLLA